jgi:nucleoside-diphosphate-sugar epimerase
MPAVPRLGFALVDVRDVADLHLRAMTAPSAAGQRFLGTGPFQWLSDVAALLRDGLGPQAAKVPTRKVPDAFLRLSAIFDPSIRSVIGELGQRSDYSTEKAQATLGWKPRPVRESVLDCARSLLDERAGAPAAPGAGRPHPAAAG